MNLINSLDSTICVHLALVLCHFLWQGLVIAMLAAAGSWLLRLASPQIRYWIHIGAMALMVACLPATYLMVARTGSEPPAVTIAPAEIEPQPLERAFETAGPLPPATVVVSEIPPATIPTEIVIAEPPLPPIVETTWFPWDQAAKYATLAYLCGALLMLVRLLIGLRGGQRLRRAAVSVEDPALLATFRQQAQRLGLRVLPAIATCRRVATPVVVGILRPMILLPVSFATGLTAEQAAIVLTHELAHIRRYDHLVNLLQRAVEAVLFFHPAVWYVSHRASVERENCCDDMVVAAGAEPFHYAESLLRIAELSCRQRSDVSHPAVGVLAASGRRPSQLRGRILRLLGGSQGPEVRLTRLGMAGIMATLVLLAAAPVLMPSLANSSAETSAAVEEKPTTESPYSHFLYVRHNEEKGSAKTDSLVLAKVTPDGFQQRDIFTKSNLHLGWYPLDVINGWAYGVKLGDLIAINLESGATEQLGSHVGTYAYDSGRLYTLMSIADRHQSNVLRVHDLRNRSYRDIGLDAKVNQHGIQRLAVSPDQQRLAFFNPLGNWMAPTAFRLAVVDLSNGLLKEHPTTVFARGFQTGGGDHGPGPTFTWLDAKTILMAHDVPKDPPKDPAAHVNFSGATSKVATMDIATGQLTEVLTLPQWQRRLGEPRMPLGQDRVPRIMLGELGQYRIDVKNRQLVEDNTLGGEYRYVRGREPEKLFYRDTLLAEGKPIPEVGMSPDGRRAVWLTARGSPSEMRYYDAAEGNVRTIAKGWFPTFDVWGRWGSSESIILWAMAENLAPAPVQEVPKGWQRLVSSPYPEPPKPPEADHRPDVSELLAMTLTTDKPAYAHYQQVQLTVTLTNKTDKDVSFKRPEPFSNCFGLVGTGPRVSGVIDLFDRTGGILPTDPVVIKAGASLRITRPYEPIGIGEHVVTATPKLGDQKWQGRLKVTPIKFTVALSDRETYLLMAKFDRFLKLCQEEFAKDPATCNPYRFLDLEAEAVPLLVAAIESSDNPQFRQRMGYALARIATADALPLFKKLLAGDMQHDQEMVLEGLLTMVQRGRSADEALVLLMESLGHSSNTVRRGAAAHLRQLHDTRVAAAFERAIEDSDAATATIAARYLASYENLGLADWLAAVIAKPTHARYLAVRSIVVELEKTWGISHGPLPAAPWKEASADTAAMEQFRKVLQAWEVWARQNPRSSEHFFDADRKPWERDHDRQVGAKMYQPPKTTTPDGVTVELIGVSRYPDKEQPWWRPDGERMAEPPFDSSGIDIRSGHDPKSQVIELVLRLGGAAGGPAYLDRVKGATADQGALWTGRRWKDGKPLDDLLVFAVNVPLGLKTVDIPLQLSAGKWKTVLRIDAQPAVGTRQFSTKKVDGDGLLLTLRHEPSDATLHQQRAVATDAEGRTHVGICRETRPAGATAESDWLFRGLSDEPGRIRSVEIQSRPYQYEPITLQNISVEPGWKTEPKLTAERSGPDVPLATATAWGLPIQAVQMRLRIDQAQWRQGLPPQRLLVDFRNNGAKVVGLPGQQSCLEVEINGQTFRWSRSHADIWLPLDPGSERTIVVGLDGHWGEAFTVLARPGRHSIRIISPDPSWNRSGSPSIRVTTFPLQVDVVDGLPTAKQPEVSWGPVGNGLQCRLLPVTQVAEPSSGDIWDMTVYVTYEVRNVSDKAVRFLPWGCTLEGVHGNVFNVMDREGKTVAYWGQAERRPPTAKSFLTIQPGQTVSGIVGGLRYDFTKPGLYRITATKTASAHDNFQYYYASDPEKAADNPDNVWTGDLISNEVTVNIVPGKGPSWTEPRELFTIEQPVDDRAVIYHYRLPSWQEGSQSDDVLSNGTPLTRIGNGGFYKEVVKSGPRIYKNKPNDAHGAFFVATMTDNAFRAFLDAYSLDAKSGQTYYLRWKSAGFRSHVKQVPRDQALRELEGLRSFPPARAVAAGTLAPAPNPPAVPEIAWGQVVRGLQAGLRFADQNRAYQLGERVNFAVLVRNTGDKAVTVVDYGMLGSPTVRTTDGKSFIVAGPTVDRPVQARRSELKPGAVFEVGQVGFYIGEDRKQQSVQLTPGKYLVSQTCRFHDTSSGRATWSGELTTSEITLSVVAADGSSDNKTPATQTATQSAANPLAMQPGTLAFGPEIERVIVRPANATMENCWALNLASGNVVTSTPKQPLDFRVDGTETLRAAGVDLYQQPYVNSADAVNTLDMRLVSLDADGWNMPAADAVASLERNAAVSVKRSEAMISGSHVYVFSTRDGARGVLQILKDSVPTKIRYKLVQPTEVLSPAILATEGQVQTDWSAPQDGVQMRVWVDKVQWKAGEIPTLQVECRNSGKALWWVPKTEPGLTILVDGKSYYKPENNQRQFSDRLEPDKTVALTNVVLSGWWLTHKENGPLVFQPGKHRVQVVCRPRQIGSDAGALGRQEESGKTREVTIKSNPVEFEIQPAASRDASLPIVNVWVGADGRRASVYQNGRLVFFDGLSPEARRLAEVDAKDQQVAVSPLGRYVAACTQFIGVAGPARIYDASGTKVGEFQLDNIWKVKAISDVGPIVALDMQLDGPSPTVVRLCDRTGKVLADYTKDSGSVAFSRTGIPVVWGARKGSNNAFVAVLNERCQPTATHEKPNQEIRVHEAVPSPDASLIALVEGPHGESFADRVTLWRPGKTAQVPVSVSLPKDLGVIQPTMSALSFAPGGAYLAVRIGATGIGLIDTTEARLILVQDLKKSAAVLFTKVLDAVVTDEGATLAILYGEGQQRRAVHHYCLLDKRGKLVGVEPIQGFSAGSVSIQALGGCKYAITGGNGRVVVVSAAAKPAAPPAGSGESLPTTERGRELFRKVIADIGKVDFLLEHWSEKGNVGGPRHSLVLRTTERVSPKDWLSVAIAQPQATQIVTKLTQLGIFDQLTDHTYNSGSPTPEWAPPQPKRKSGYLLHVLLDGKATRGEAFVDLSGDGDEAGDAAVAKLVHELRADLAGQAAEAADTVLLELSKEATATQPADAKPAAQNASSALPTEKLVGLLSTLRPVQPAACDELARRWRPPAPITPDSIQHFQAVRSPNGQYVAFFTGSAFDGRGVPTQAGDYVALVRSDGKVLWSKAIRFAQWPAVSDQGTVAVPEWLKEPSLVRARLIDRNGKTLGTFGVPPTELYLENWHQNKTIRSAFGVIVAQGFSRDDRRFYFVSHSEYDRSGPRLVCIDRAAKEQWTVPFVRRLVLEPGETLEVSPDGRYILVAQTFGWPSTGFVVVTADGRQVLDVKKLGRKAEFRFAPDKLTVVDDQGQREYPLVALTGAKAATAPAAPVATAPIMHAWVGADDRKLVVPLARLPDRHGATVELRALRGSEKEGPWWDPDGRPLDRPVLNEKVTQTKLSGRRGQAELPELVLAVTPGQVKEGNGDTGPYVSDAAPVADSGDWRYAISSDGQRATICIPCGSGEWQTLTVTDGRSPAVRATKYGQVSFEAAKGAELAGTYRIADRQVRLVAIDHEGREFGGQPARLFASEADDGTRSFKQSFSLAPEKTREFLLQTRPWVWAVFRDVALKPGEITQVKVSVVDRNPLAEAKPAKPDADARPVSRTTISGRVLDKPGGEPVSNAKVTIWSAWTFNRQFAQTDANGVYTFVPDTPGPYTLRLTEQTTALPVPAITETKAGRGADQAAGWGDAKFGLTGIIEDWRK